MLTNRRNHSLAKLVAQVCLAALVASGTLVCLGRAVAQDSTATAPAAKPSLYEIAKRFGTANPKMLALSLMIEIAPSGSEEASLQDAVALTAQALDESNAGADLATPPVPTGDALFDRYALAVDVRINALPVEAAQQVLTVAALPDAELAAWEPEFGQDPRYWELRYLCAKAQGDQAELSAGYQHPRDFLAEARARGIASTNTLLLLFNELREEHAQELEPFTDYGPEWQQWWDNKYVADHIPARPQLDPALVQQSAELQAGFEKDELALLDEAVAAGPDEAWGYYYRALYWYELGEEGRGLAELAQGNAAQVWIWPIPFPSGRARDGAMQSAPPGSSVIAGAISGMFNNAGVPYPFGGPVKIRQGMMADALYVADPNATTSAFEQWHHFGCKYGVNGFDSLDAVQSRGFITITRRDFEETVDRELTDTQRETLNRMLGASQEFNTTWSKGVDFDDPVKLLTVLAMAGGARGVAVALYLADFYEAQVSHKCHGFFEDYSQVHYPELKLPECMLKYENLSWDELMRRKEAKRAARQAELDTQIATETETESQ